MSGSWVLLRGDGQWAPRATPVAGGAVDVNAGTLFATAAECSEFIRTLVAGHVPAA